VKSKNVQRTFQALPKLAGSASRERDSRGEDRDEVIDRRLRDAAEEIRRYRDYHYVLINRELSESDAILGSIVRAERVRRTRIEEQIRPILESFQV